MESKERSSRDSVFIACQPPMHAYYHIYVGEKVEPFVVLGKTILEMLLIECCSKFKLQPYGNG